MIRRVAAPIADHPVLAFAVFFSIFPFIVPYQDRKSVV